MNTSEKKKTIAAIVGVLVAAALCVAVVVACVTLFPHDQQAGGDDNTSSQTIHRDNVPDASSQEKKKQEKQDKEPEQQTDTKDDEQTSDGTTKSEEQTSTDSNTDDTNNSNENTKEESGNQSTEKKDTSDNNTGGTKETGGINKVRLNVPTSVQETAYWCGPASLQMVLKYKGISVSQASLAQQLNTSSVTGTEYVDLQRVANRYLFGKDLVGANDPGYHVQTLNRYDTNPQITTDFVRRMKLDISTNDPFFAAVDVHSLYPELGVANHMVVVSGYATRSGSDEVTSVYFLDPSYLVQDKNYGGLKVAPLSDFVSAIVNNDEPAYIY